MAAPKRALGSETKHFRTTEREQREEGEESPKAERRTKGSQQGQAMPEGTKGTKYLLEPKALITNGGGITEENPKSTEKDTGKEQVGGPKETGPQDTTNGTGEEGTGAP